MKRLVSNLEVEMVTDQTIFGLNTDEVSCLLCCYMIIVCHHCSDFKGEYFMYTQMYSYYDSVRMLPCAL